VGRGEVSTWQEKPDDDARLLGRRSRPGDMLMQTIGRRVARRQEKALSRFLESTKKRLTENSSDDNLSNVLSRGKRGKTDPQRRALEIPKNTNTMSKRAGFTKKKNH